MATTTQNLLIVLGGNYLVAGALGITLSCVIYILYLVFKGRKGDAYASLQRHE